MSVTILPYLTDVSQTTTSVSNQPTTSQVAQAERNSTTFKETLDAVMKATAAVAIDNLVKASSTGAVNADIVQEFFNQNGIQITLPNVQTADTLNNIGFTQAATSSTTSADNTTSTEDLNVYFEEAANQYHVDIKLLKAIAYCESGFNPHAVSSAGAVGVMQLMPKTAEGLGVTDSYDPRQNILGGAKLISQLLDKYDGDKSLALAAYNAGSGNVSKYGGIPPFKETQNYVKKVLEKYSES